jgi:hypothetical protein
MLRNGIMHSAESNESRAGRAETGSLFSGVLAFDPFSVSLKTP